MDFSRAFTFPFKEQNWVSKLLIGGLIAMVPVVNFALFGWALEITRRVMRQETEELPGWDDFGKKFMDGLYYFIASFVYALPIVIVSCIMMATLPMMGGLLSGGDVSDEVAGLFASGSGLLITCLSCIMIVYGVVLSVILPGLMVHYAQEGNFGAFFKFGDVFSKVRENAGTFFTAWIVALLAGFVIGFLLSIISTILGLIPCIGWIAILLLSIATAPYMSAIYAHIFGQYGQKAYGTGDLPAVQ